MILCQWSTSHVELTGAARPTYHILTSKLATLPFVQTKDIAEIKKKKLDLCGTNAHSSGNASNGWE